MCASVYRGSPCKECQHQYVLHRSGAKACAVMNSALGTSHNCDLHTQNSAQRVIWWSWWECIDSWNEHQNHIPYCPFHMETAIIHGNNSTCLGVLSNNAHVQFCTDLHCLECICRLLSRFFLRHISNFTTFETFTHTPIMIRIFLYSQRDMFCCQISLLQNRKKGHATFPRFSIKQNDFTYPEALNFKCRSITVR